MLIAFFILFILLVCIAETFAAFIAIAAINDAYGPVGVLVTLFFLTPGTIGIWMGGSHLMNQLTGQ